MPSTLYRSGDHPWRSHIHPRAFLEARLIQGVPQTGICTLGPRDRLDVDFLALLADRAAAAGVVSASSQGSAIEPVLELLAVLGFPRLDRQ